MPTASRAKSLRREDGEVPAPRAHVDDARRVLGHRRHRAEQRRELPALRAPTPPQGRVGGRGAACASGRTSRGRRAARPRPPPGRPDRGARPARSRQRGREPLRLAARERAVVERQQEAVPAAPRAPGAAGRRPPRGRRGCPARAGGCGARLRGPRRRRTRMEGIRLSPCGEAGSNKVGFVPGCEYKWRPCSPGSGSPVGPRRP